LSADVGVLGVASDFVDLGGGGGYVFRDGIQMRPPSFSDDCSGHEARRTSGDGDDAYDELKKLVDSFAPKHQRKSMEIQHNAAGALRPRSGGEIGRQGEDVQVGQVRRILFSDSEAMLSKLLQKITQDCDGIQAFCRGASEKARQTTVGLVLHDLFIDGIAPGGPAAESNMLERGDRILKVDGHTATADGCAQLLQGSDVAGTFVTLAVRKARSGESKNVTLRRAQLPNDEGRLIFHSLARIRALIPASDEHIVRLIDTCVQQHRTNLVKESKNIWRISDSVENLHLRSKALLQEVRRILVALFKNMLALEGASTQSHQSQIDHLSELETMQRNLNEMRALKDQAESAMLEAVQTHIKHRQVAYLSHVRVLQ